LIFFLLFSGRLLGIDWAGRLQASLLRIRPAGSSPCEYTSQAHGRKRRDLRAVVPAVPGHDRVVAYHGFIATNPAVCHKERLYSRSQIEIVLRELSITTFRVIGH
jgi:hypothetical protein